MHTKIKDFIYCIFVTNNLLFWSKDKTIIKLLSFLLLIAYLFLFSNITIANEIVIIDCKRMSPNTTETYSDENQKQARKRLNYLIEAIYYGVDYKDINKFIESENTVNSLIRGVKNEIIKATKKIKDTSKKIERLKKKLDLHGKKCNTDPIRKEVIYIDKILKFLLVKLIENQNNIISQRKLFQQIIDCLKATQEDINIKIIKKKEQILKQTKDTTGKDYDAGAINDYLKAIQNVYETIVDLQLSFSPVEKFTQEILSIFKHLIGMASNFDASKEKILTLLINLSSISGKIKQPEYENRIKEHIPKIKQLNERIEKFGYDINNYLEKIEKNNDYKPKYKSRLKPSTYNDLSDSIIDLLTEWKSCNEVLKQIYFMSYQIRIKDAIIKVKTKFQYIDDIENVRIILPGEYKVLRYEETGENTDDNTVTLTNKKSGDEHDISKTNYYKIINSQ